MSRPVDLAVELNNRWRLRDDGAQWILERRERRSTRRSTGYVGRSYSTQRRTLRRSITEHCGDVDAGAIRRVDNLPERYRNRAIRC